MAISNNFHGRRSNAAGGVSINAGPEKTSPNILFKGVQRDLVDAAARRTINDQPFAPKGTPVVREAQKLAA